MTVATAENCIGELWNVVAETEADFGEASVEIESESGNVHSDLTIGAAVGDASRLAANAGLCFQGMNLVGKGFRLSAEEVEALGYDIGQLPKVLKLHSNARDLLQGGGFCYVIDFFGYTAEQARSAHPGLYQWLLDRVKPERDLNNRPSRRKNWWLFGEPVGKLRSALAGQGLGGMPIRATSLALADD
jgi:hypothetical protein